MLPVAGIAWYLKNGFNVMILYDTGLGGDANYSYFNEMSLSTEIAVLHLSRSWHYGTRSVVMYVCEIQ